MTSDTDTSILFCEYRGTATLWQKKQQAHVSLIQLGVIWNYNVLEEEQLICNPAYQQTLAGLIQPGVIDPWNQHQPNHAGLTQLDVIDLWNQHQPNHSGLTQLDVIDLWNKDLGKV